MNFNLSESSVCWYTGTDLPYLYTGTFAELFYSMNSQYLVDLLFCIPVPLLNSVPHEMIWNEIKLNDLFDLD
jgi:hypothetical protein